MLMHTGQGENLFMGYQMCFMLVTVLAGALLALIVRCDGNRDFRDGILATVLGWLLLTCGAAGLCYGVAAPYGSSTLAFVGGMRLWQRLLLVGLAAMTPIYIVLYFQGYHRPSHHPPSAGLFESIRIGLEAQAMALGPAATGLWPFVGIAIVGLRRMGHRPATEIHSAQIPLSPLRGGRRGSGLSAFCSSLPPAPRLRSGSDGADPGFTTTWDSLGDTGG